MEYFQKFGFDDVVYSNMEAAEKLKISAENLNSMLTTSLAENI